MTSRPAYDDITLALGTDTLRLRPSLRAASHFVRLDGFTDLPKRIAEFHLGTIREVITVATIDRQQTTDFLDRIDRTPMRIVSDAIAGPILALCTAFIPASDDNAKPDPNAKPMPWPDLYRELFRKATGWLGWTPEAAWSATPTEINEAFAGHIAMLEAIHGAPERDAAKQPDTYTADRLRKIEEQGFDPAFDRDGLRALKTKLKRAA